jgi:chemotaxis protein methyltransferase CheR
MSVASAFAKPLPGISPEVYGDADFRAVAKIVYASSGNVLPDGKAMLVYSRLAPLVRESGSATFSNYVTLIRSDAVEQARAVAALTTNHTFFYRESHHFTHCETELRPDLVRRLEKGDSVRIWSAGCSSGEETWSLVMTLLGSDRMAGRRIAARDLRVLASDIAPLALAKASAATYPEQDLKAVPSELVQQWAKCAGGTATIVDEARAIVRFRSLNLLDDWPMKGRFDIIFCRNVMIYFDHETKERLVERFAGALKPGGCLYIGHSERVSGDAAQQLQLVGPTIYRRKSA